jgi:hypothetical protein
MTTSDGFAGKSKDWAEGYRHGIDTALAEAWGQAIEKAALRCDVLAHMADSIVNSDVAKAQRDEAFQRKAAYENCAGEIRAMKKHR